MSTSLRNALRTGVESCATCGKRRKCSQSDDDRDPLTGEIKSWMPRYCLAECLEMSPSDRSVKRKKCQEERRANRPRIAYPIIGGPLDGKHAATIDFYDDGMYAHLSGEYVEFNSAGSKRIGGRPTMIYVHSSLLKTLISARDR